MIAILNSLFLLLTDSVYSILSNLMLLASFILAEMIHLLTTPLGFISVTSSIIFIEYLITKSIIKDLQTINIKKTFNYAKNYIKSASLVLSPLNALNVIFKKTNIHIKKIPINIGITIGVIVKLKDNLISWGLNNA